jgi:hypothetical protein
MLLPERFDVLDIEADAPPAEARARNRALGCSEVIDSTAADPQHLGYFVRIDHIGLLCERSGGGGGAIAYWQQVYTLRPRGSRGNFFLERIDMAEIRNGNAIVLTTIRITAGLRNAEPSSVGTGFLYKVAHAETNYTKVLLVTNKHVVRGAEVVHFLISHAPSMHDFNEQHQPVGREDQLFTVQIAGNLNFYPHRDKDVDLCAIDVTIPMGNLMGSGRKVRSLIIDASWLPTAIDRKNMSIVEPVRVVGYPNGLFDTFNNMPIARQGSTATHPLAYYNNKKNFLIDVAAYGGSSGSPVFRFESPFYHMDDGTLAPGSKAQFLGVVWGVVEKTSSGAMHVVEIPSAHTQVPMMQTSLNLAIALHGDLIRDFDDQIFPTGAPWIPSATFPAGSSLDE